MILRWPDDDLKPCIKQIRKLLLLCQLHHAMMLGETGIMFTFRNQQICPVSALCTTKLCVGRTSKHKNPWNEGSCKYHNTILQGSHKITFSGKSPQLYPTQAHSPSRFHKHEENTTERCKGVQATVISLCWRLEAFVLRL